MLVKNTRQRMPQRAMAFGWLDVGVLGRLVLATFGDIFEQQMGQPVKKENYYLGFEVCQVQRGQGFPQIVVS